MNNVENEILVTVDEKENTKKTKIGFFNKHKIKLIIASILASIILIFASIPMSDEKKIEIVMETYNEDGLNSALLKIDKLYKNQDALAMKYALIENDAKWNTSMEIVETELERTSYSSNYAYIYTTIRNTGSYDISYLEYDITFYDSTGNIVGSDWSNCSNLLRPGQVTIDDAYVRVPNNCSRYVVTLREKY